MVLAVVVLAVSAARSAVENRGAEVLSNNTVRLSDGRVLKNARPHVRRASGGYCLKKIEGPVIAVRNRQSVYSAAEVATAVEHAMRAVYLPVVVVDDKDADVKKATEIVLVDTAADGATVLVAPEQHRVQLAVSWLVSDSPKADKRAARLGVELTRAVAMSFGCGISMFLPDVMVNVENARDLDRLTSAPIGPSTSNVIDDAARRLGMKKIVYASYRKACQEGWAPAPTNDVQRTIWKEVHEIPSTPLTIEKK